MKKKIVALVPMRHYSKRIPKKNYRSFNGKPLFYWILKTLSSLDKIDEIYINTDSPIIKRETIKISKKINIINRPKKLCSDKIPMNDILLYDVSRIDADIYLQTHSTNPLLKKETIERAIDTFLKAKNNDSLFSVTKLQSRFWTHNARPINHNPKVLLRTQDLKFIYEENSNIYIFTKENLQRLKTRVGEKPILFEIPKDESLDIDEEIDFRIAECISKINIR